MLPQRPAGHFIEVERILGHAADLSAPGLAPGDTSRLGLDDREHARERQLHEVERPEWGSGRPSVFALLGVVGEANTAQGEHQHKDHEFCEPTNPGSPERLYR
jgi:hypothetical protein